MASTVEATSESTALVREDNGSIAAFASGSNFDAAQRMAKALASSTVVPSDYRGNIANCLVAMELASRTGASVLMVMQNLHIIQGKPSWSAAFLVASINSCGRFSSLRFETVGSDAFDKAYKVRAYATEKASGEKLYGTWITWVMVNGEGWASKPGSKWKTMPEQMFMYRAASFWARAYAPEISLGMHTAEEMSDTADARPRVSVGAASLNEALVDVVPEVVETVQVDDLALIREAK
jgi:hypothetical protein